MHVDSTTRFLSAFHPQHHHHCYHPHHRHRRYHQHQNHHCHHHHPHLDDYIMMVPMHARQIKDQHSSVLSASQPVFGRQWQTHIDNSSSSSKATSIIIYKLLQTDQTSNGNVMSSWPFNGIEMGNTGHGSFKSYQIWSPLCRV